MDKKIRDESRIGKIEMSGEIPALSLASVKEWPSLCETPGQARNEAAGGCVPGAVPRKSNDSLDLGVTQE
jgi:hypothetical protein